MTKPTLPTPAKVKAAIAAAQTAVGEGVAEVVFQPDGAVRVIFTGERSGINPADLVDMRK